MEGIGDWLQNLQPWGENTRPLIRPIEGLIDNSILIMAPSGKLHEALMV